MGRVVLISCVSKKLSRRARAQDLYVSPLFRKNLCYAKSLAPDKIFILSAKYGLLGLNQEIEPYDKTLNELSSGEVKAWASSVFEELKKSADIEKDEFIFLAGINYRKFLTPYLKNYAVPMEGLGIGKQLRWLSLRIKNE